MPERVSSKYALEMWQESDLFGKKSKSGCCQMLSMTNKSLKNQGVHLYPKSPDLPFVDAPISNDFRPLDNTTIYHKPSKTVKFNQLSCLSGKASQL